MIRATTFQNIEERDVLTEIKRCTTDDPTGFYMEFRDKTVQVSCIKDASRPENRVILDHGVTLKVIDLASHSDVLCASFPASEVSISESLEVYYAGLSLLDGEFMAYKGRISSIQIDDKGLKTFTIVGPSASDEPGNPVFTYDPINKILHLAGIILFPGQEDGNQPCKAAHSDLLRLNEEKIRNLLTEEQSLGETRGGIQVGNGNFKGLELGKGRGPRSILINGGCPEVVYKLILIDGNGKETNPHDDGKYNKDQKTLYQTALDNFVLAYNQNQQLPLSFEFQCYKNSYIAKNQA